MVFIFQPPTDEKTWKESKWKKLSTKKDPNPSFKEEEETLLHYCNKEIELRTTLAT